MRTLYVRIVAIFIVISLLSAVLGLLVTNQYYTSKLQEFNEQQIVQIGKEIRHLYHESDQTDLADFMTRIAGLGYQIYIVNDRYEASAYGDPFRDTELSIENIRHVLDGEIYDGLLKEKRFLQVAGYFENSIRNSVGIPLSVHGQAHAMFVRPNLEQQIGEVRILLALLLGYGFLFSLILIVVLSRYIVRPLKKLTVATKQIVEGDYNIELDVKRKDEIGNLANHFSQMAESLQRLDEMRQEFVANVSHEFQTPVTSIQGFSEAMLNNETTAEEAKQYLQIIHDESRRLSLLSKQLLTLAVLDKDTGAIKKMPYRLDEQIRQALIMLEWQWADKQLIIEPHLPEVIVTADPQLLNHVWLNLLANSIKFCNPGGVIHIRMSVEKDIIIQFSDTGIGISAKELPHIFERFYKSDQARNKGGSGLGLSIVKRIIEVHHGRIETASKQGAGTTFTVYLPLL